MNKPEPPAGIQRAPVWINGSLIDPDEARVSPFDHGLLTGDGVFETLRTVGGQPFAVSRHLDRLARSAAGLGLRAPADDVLRRAVEAVAGAGCALAGGGEVRVRITVTGGPAPLGSDRGDAEPLVIVASGPLPQWPPSTGVVMAPWTRNERGALAGLKTTSYGENVKALAYAHDRGASEALVANCAGRLCEGTGTNVFVGRGGRLLTPPLSSGCLAGVTRALVLELTEAEEADLSPADLATADEAFLTSSTRDVQPIRDVDGTSLVGCPGPLTRAAAAVFADLLARDIDP